MVFKDITFKNVLVSVKFVLGVATLYENFSTDLQRKWVFSFCTFSEMKSLLITVLTTIYGTFSD